jgi:hypothetical protein
MRLCVHGYFLVSDLAFALGSILGPVLARCSTQKPKIPIKFNAKWRRASSLLYTQPKIWDQIQCQMEALTCQNEALAATPLPSLYFLKDTL